MTDVIPRRPRRTEEAALHTFYQGGVVSPHARDGAVALNPTALALWELCDGRTTVEEMVQAVCQLFAVPAHDARRDVESALRTMLAEGVLR